MVEIKRYIGILIAITLLGSTVASAPVLADDEDLASYDTPEQVEVEVCYDDTVCTEEEDKLEDIEMDDSTVRSAYLILQLQSRVSQKTAELSQIQEQIDTTKEELIVVRESIDTLNGQIANLDSLIEESERKIESVTSQITEGESELIDLMEEIEMRQLQVEDQKSVIGELMEIIYLKKNIYYEEGNEINTLTLLLAEGSVSDVMQDMTYMDILEETGAELLELLEESERELIVSLSEAEEKTGILNSLEVELWEEKQNLIAEKSGKETLLAETQGKEDIYQELLILSKKNQEEIEDEIDVLRENIDLLDSKVAAVMPDLTDEEREQILQIKAEALVENGVSGASEFLELDWPVEPGYKGLSAYFDDNSYIAAFGVEHHAIDVPVIHGSPIYAPADGVVYKVVYDDESINYAYIMIAHRMGVITVYGHVSATSIKEGDYVSRGDIIGMTGGTPGSIGAGFRTTGAHLHFEVWQDWIVVDPLDYLDLTHISIDTLRDDYLERLQDDIEGQIEDIQATLDVLQNASYEQ